MSPNSKIRMMASVSERSGAVDKPEFPWLWTARRKTFTNSSVAMPSPGAMPKL
jgi:hypothetical protein